jgi:hypothetical protein
LGEAAFLTTLGFLAATGLTFLTTFLGFKASAETRKDPAAPAAP